MKYKLLLFILLCYYKLAFSQNTFQVQVDRDTSWSSINSRDITESINGDIYVISIGGTNLSHLNLTKINSQGIVEWDTLYSFTPFAEFFPRIIPAHDGGVIVGCTSFSYPIPDQDSIQDILLWKINCEGEIEWQKVLEARSFTDLIPTKDGNYFILGTSFNQKLDVLGYKITQSGEVMWKNTFGNSDFWGEPITVKEIKGRTYITTQESKNPLSWPKDNYIFGIDDLGKVVSEVKITRETGGTNYRIGQLFELQNTVYFRLDQYYILDTQNEVYEPLDSNNSFSEYALDLTCNKRELKAIRSLSEEPNTLLYRYYDSVSEPIYEKTIPNISGSIKGQVATADGGFVVLTNHFGNDWFQVSKVDCQGNLEFWNGECKSKITKGSSIVLYPNPTQNSFNINANFKINKVMIFDMKGAKIAVEELCHCNKQFIDLSSLASGVYFIHVEGEGQQETQRMIKI